MIKINLPNPIEMTVPEFFAYMKIALKSAEKSYEEMIKGIDLTDTDNAPWATFTIGEDAVYVAKNTKEGFDPNEYDCFQDIVLEIKKP